MHAVRLFRLYIFERDKRLPRWMIFDLVELVLALTDAVHHVDRHRREGEPADERDEEAACRGPESTHMRVLLDGALVERFAIEPYSDFSAK